MLTDMGQARFQQVVWQQDGATCHTARMVMRNLNGVFGHRLLAKNCIQGQEWALASPDMTPLDFFLWSFVKMKVYTAPLPQNLNQLTQRITNVFANLDPEMVIRAINNMKDRARKVVAINGNGFEGLNM